MITKKADDKQEIPTNQAPLGSKLFKHGQHHFTFMILKKKTKKKKKKKPRGASIATDN